MPARWPPRTWARRRAAAAGVTAEEGASVKVPPAFCYEILEVLGQREVDPSKLVGKKRRNAVADEDRAVSYLVRATFCEDKDDDGLRGRPLGRPRRPRGEPR